jgi:hypothetical protein
MSMINTIKIHKMIQNVSSQTRPIGIVAEFCCVPLLFVQIDKLTNFLTKGGRKMRK